MPKKSPKRLFFIVVAVGLLVFGFVYLDKNFSNIFSDNNKGKDKTNTASDSPTTIIGNGFIEAPANVNVDDLQVASLGTTAGVDQDGEFETPLYKESYTPVIAMLPDKEFGLTGLNEPGKNNVTINTQTTAETLVFMSPYLISNDPKLAKEIIDIIKRNNKVKEFAEVIEETLQKDVEPLNDAKYLEAFGGAIESVLLELNNS